MGIKHKYSFWLIFFFSLGIMFSYSCNALLLLVLPISCISILFCRKAWRIQIQVFLYNFLSSFSIFADSSSHRTTDFTSSRSLDWDQRPRRPPVAKAITLYSTENENSIFHKHTHTHILTRKATDQPKKPTNHWTYIKYVCIRKAILKVLS